MISSTSYKIKSPKATSRDVHDFIKEIDDHSLDDDVENSGSFNTFDTELRTPPSYSREPRFKTRSKPFEFRPNRCENDRKTNWRGSRGRFGYRRFEQDINDSSNYVQNRKFQDVVKDGYGNKSNLYPKFQDAEKDKDWVLPRNHAYEDTRISKLIRRLSQETDQEKSLEICRKLLDAVLISDNARYVHRTFITLADTLFEVMCLFSGLATKKEAARILGRIGYIMGDEFHRYSDWVFNQKYSLPITSEEVKILLIKSFQETLTLEHRSNKIQKYATELMSQILTILEATDVPEIFICTTEVVLSLEEIYPDVFVSHFRDTVDILLGWHVDTNQSIYIIEFASRSLVKLSDHWQSNIGFSLNLISQFLEDIEPYGEQLRCIAFEECVETDMSVKDMLERITALVRAFCTVVKCLDDKFNPAYTTTVSFGFVADCLSKIIVTTIQALRVQILDNLVISSNECIALLLGIVHTKTDESEIYNLIDVQLSKCKLFQEETNISMLLMISKVIKELSNQLPIEIVEKLLGPDSPLHDFRFTSEQIQDALVKVYQSLLSLKNIPLLQEAYRYVLCNLEMCYKDMVFRADFGLKNPFDYFYFDMTEAEFHCMFLLRCLSLLANSSNSVIGMWALKPSILEVFAMKLNPSTLKVGVYTPVLQYSIIHLLYTHSCCYSHFVSSSNLISHPDTKTNLIDKLGIPNSLNISDVTSSPSSNNLTIILKTICKCLKTDIILETKRVILRWLQEILELLRNYFKRLTDKHEFTDVIYSLIHCGYTTNPSVSKAVYENLKIVTVEPLLWNKDLYIALYELCTLHMSSTNPKIQTDYCDLMALIPWFITFSHVIKNDIETIKSAHVKDYTGGMLHYHFKKFCNYIFGSANLQRNWLQDTFCCCSPIKQTHVETIRYRSKMLNSEQLLNFWVTWETAYFCVNNKLRTPLGKPTETFTNIENCLKRLAKSIYSPGYTMTPEEHKRMFLLLNFMEHLEKLIYNASEGCAGALSQPSKPVRIFFHTNALTCREWLTRTRVPVIEIALQNGYSTLAIRNCHAKLKDFKDMDSVEFERTVLGLATAYTNIKEPEALQGLYVWCKKHDKNLPFLKCAADQAKGKYEKALVDYEVYLREYETENSEKRQKQFIFKQILNCYRNLSDWNNVTAWKNDITNDADIHYNQSFLDKIEDLSKWSTIKPYCSTVLESIESEVYKSSLDIAKYKHISVEEFDTELHNLQRNINRCLGDLSSDYARDLLLMHHALLELKSVIYSFDYDLSRQINYQQEIDVSLLLKITYWFEHFGKLKSLTNTSVLNNLHLDISNLALKNQNYITARQHLSKCLLKKNNLNIENNGSIDLEHVVQHLLNTKIDKNYWTLENTKAIMELSKLLYTTKKSAALNICATVCSGVSQLINNTGAPELRELGGKTLIKLSKWISAEEDSQLLKEVTSPLGKFIMVLPDVGGKSIDIVNMSAGKLLQYGIRQYPASAKIWSEFGEWCYKRGQKDLETSHTSGHLTENDRKEIEKILPSDMSSEDVQCVLDILSQSEMNNKDNTTLTDVNMVEKIENQLELMMARLRIQCNIQALVEIWRKSQKRLYHFYELSADAYFHCLELCTSEDYSKKDTECLQVKVVLRLLRYVVKYAMELQTVLEEGLAKTPTHPWKAIIPQLFSRLNHSEEYVRQQVSNLLCRIAEVAPHLIVFPAVVGAVEGGHKFYLNDIAMLKDYLTESNELADIDEEFDDSECEESRDALHSCFMSMVEILSKQAPETITQVQVFVNELRRISLLWDELWISTLTQHNAEIMKRLSQLDLEITKTQNNPNLSPSEKEQLIIEKHRIIIKPIVFILEQLNAITSREPETPHEVMFQDRYSKLINEVLNKLKNPDNPHKPQELWQSLKVLQAKLQQKSHKKGSYILRIDDISPLLHEMEDTLIAMPGLGNSTRVTITAISDHLNVLPTKTKPKKLFFHGSNGKIYTYLFKGMEDLHLDERIMQFLTIANKMMAKKLDSHLYRARHYSVIPLGLRSGLIRWVDGTDPLFSLYKRWQMREVSVTNMRQGTSTAVALRPSEMYYNKLNPLLKEHGVKNLDNRKEWPLTVLKKVLTELMNETPNYLLQQELWCQNVTTDAWWKVVKNYSHSVAVMSIIGYIIGLGDRHLDNVLIDLKTGDVIHIDYNVCFEKGKQLRVPEKVPFRMTPNMEMALGPTGVEVIMVMAFFEEFIVNKSILRKCSDHNGLQILEVFIILKNKTQLNLQIIGLFLTLHLHGNIP